MGPQYITQIDINEMRYKIRTGIIEKKSLLSSIDTESLKNTEEINVENIMKKIRREVLKEHPHLAISYKRDSEEKHGFEITNRNIGSSIINHNETRLFTFLKRAKKKLERYSFFMRAINRFKHIFPEKWKHDNNISLGELLKYDDEEFLTNVYKVLLYREPDQFGLSNYLYLLRNNKIDKLGVLGGIRFSKEGKQYGAKVRYLRIKYVLNRIKRILYRIPIIGYLFKFIIFFLTMPQKFFEMQKSVLQKLDNMQLTSDKNNNELKDKINNLEIDISNVQTNLMKNNAENSDKFLVLNDRLMEIYKNVSDILKQQSDYGIDISKCKKRIKILEGNTNEKLLQITNIIQTLGFYAEENLDDVYIEFENRFRGAREEIKDRLAVYLPYIEAVKNTEEFSVLDMGCGRGEWLELLKEHGYDAEGLDVNKAMIETCDDLGLNAINMDMLDYLKSQEPNSYNAITAFQVIEHVEYKALIKIIDESYRVLKPGGVIIFETPNPENLIVGSCNFYFDPTHKHPLPPGLISYTVEARGFTKAEILRLHPYGFLDNDITDESVKKLSVLFNAGQDYAVIAYKKQEDL